MIVIEGMDNTGKSTLCETLSKEFLLPVVRRSGPYQDFAEWEHAINLDIDQTLPVIRDRVPAISELVYGTILRGGSIAGDDHWDYLERFLNKNLILIYCRPGAKTILDWGNRDQMEGVIENNERLIHAYDRLIDIFEDSLQLKVHHYDFTEEGALQKLLLAIEEDVIDMISTHSAFQRLSTFNFLEGYNER